MTPAETTIKDQAKVARQYAFANYGGPTFAQLCMAFDYRVCEAARERAISLSGNDKAHEDDAERLEEVLKLLAFHLPAPGEDTLDMALAFCWLDAKGYGTLTLETLEQILETVRQSSRVDKR